METYLVLKERVIMVASERCVISSEFNLAFHWPVAMTFNRSIEECLYELK